VVSAIWGESPLSPLDLTNQTTHHLNVHIHLSLQTTSTTLTNRLHAQTSMREIGDLG
jgi:hypothetical protein